VKKCFLFAILCLSTSALFSQEWRYIHPLAGVNIYSKLSFAYDDNIFKYAEQDIDKFINNIEPYRYPIETYDDFITTILFHAKIRRHIFGSNATTFNAKIRGNLYYLNKEKDYGSFSFSVWQKTGKRGHILSKYLFIPRYFVRYYPDFDIITPYEYPYFADCFFQKHAFLLEGGYKVIGDAELAISLSTETHNYNDSFNEYDTRKYSIGFSARIPFRKIVHTGFSYSFSTADAKGVDEPGEAKEMSDDSDISHDEDKIKVSCDIDLSENNKPFLFQSAFEVTRRLYTTDKPILVDPTHAGREDIKTIIRLGFSFIPSNRLQFTIGYIYEMKDVSTPYDLNEIEEIKNYSQNQYLTSITFSY